MVVLIICILVLLLLLVLNKQSIKNHYKILNPVSLIIYTWILVYICHYYYWPNRDYSNTIYILTTTGICFLAIGFWSSLPAISQAKDSHISTQYSYKFLKKCVQFLIFVEIFRMVHFVHIIVYKLAGGAWAMVLDSNALRNAYLHYDASIIEKIWGFSGNLMAYIGYVVLSIYLTSKYPKRWLYFTIVCLFELSIAIITMSKLSFSLFVAAILITYMNKLKNLKIQKQKFRKIAPFGVLVLISYFFFIGYQRNYMMTRDSLQDGVLDGIVNYFGGPLEALGIIIERTKSQYMFHGFESIDIGRTETNVYTWFYNFYYVGSYAGFIIIPYIIGWIAGKIYKPWKENFMYDVSNTWICLIFLFSFFDFLLRMTIFQILFIFAWFINKKWNRYIYDSGNSRRFN